MSTNQHVRNSAWKITAGGDEKKKALPLGHWLSFLRQMRRAAVIWRPAQLNRLNSAATANGNHNQAKTDHRGGNTREMKHLFPPHVCKRQTGEDPALPAFLLFFYAMSVDIIEERYQKIWELEI